jgi:transcriptional regulator with XRE-family HTH domain
MPRPPSNSELVHVLAANVRRHRASRKITQQQLADACKIDRVSVARIEGAAFASSLVTLEKISNALGCSPAQLLAKRPRARKKQV